jgi:serine/threonine protein kinase/Tol biopolymer transport system component
MPAVHAALARGARLRAPVIAAGSRLGPYEVLSALGAGGMGEVYRARDPRLARDVAVKVLPQEFFEDEERRIRFEREARLLASLNHPGIAAIHSFEEIPGSPFSSGAAGVTRHLLVMELVEGEGLDQRIAAGALPLEESLSYARQIAEALEAAHEKDIVHRDLKPANVKVTHEGRVKLLDFGLAKIFEATGSAPSVTHSPTLTARATAAGTILGTAAYMSPEQARGKPLDKRTDVWAFGCVLYEMLAGKRAFEGETVSDTLAAVLMKEPDWSALRAPVSSKVRELLRRCLQRDVKQRLRDIGDARIALEEEIGASSSSAGQLPFEEEQAVPSPSVASAEQASREGGNKRILWIAWAIAAAFAAAAGALALRARAPRETTAAPVHSIVPLPPGTRLSGWASPVLALSRDGRSLAFVAEKDGSVQQLYVHHLDRGEAQLVPMSETAEGPVFSPDGGWVLFAVDVSPAAVGTTSAGATGQLRKFSLSTGLTQEICEISDYVGATWADDGSIFFVGQQPVPLSKVSAEGGHPVPVAERVRTGSKEGPRDLAWPQILPGGKTVLVSDGDASLWGHAAVLDLESRELSDLGVEAVFSRFVPTGHLLFLQPDGTLLAARFDPSGRRTTGAPVAVLKDVTLSCNTAGAFAVSDNGVLVYASGYLRGSGRELQRLVRIGKRGEMEPLPFEPDTFGRVARPSPDGRRLAVATWDGSLWVYDLARGSRTRLPTGKVSGLDFLVWAPDGESVLFSASREGEIGLSILRQRTDSAGEPETLKSGGAEKHPLCVSPDGRTLLYMSFGGPDERGLWSLPLAPKSSASRVLAEQVVDAALSPDGRWLAYDVREAGVTEVYVQAFPRLGRKSQISSGGGRFPRWSRDGREIFFRRDDGFFVVRRAAGQELSATAPELLFRNPNVRGYDVATDREGFVAVFRPADSGIIRELHLVTGWFEALTGLAGRKK